MFEQHGGYTRSELEKIGTVAEKEMLYTRANYNLRRDFGLCQTEEEKHDFITNMIYYVQKNYQCETPLTVAKVEVRQNLLKELGIKY